MNTKNAVIILLLGVALVLSVAGCERLPDEQPRFMVESKIYELTEVNMTPSMVEVRLERIGGTLRRIDAEEIADVEGIAVVDPEGVRVPVSESLYRPDRGEMGEIALIFDVGAHTGPWTLEWPGHEPEPLEGY